MWSGYEVPKLGTTETNFVRSIGLYIWMAVMSVCIVVIPSHPGISMTSMKFSQSTVLTLVGGPKGAEQRSLQSNYLLPLKLPIKE